MAGATVVTRLLSLAGQLVLAWLLLDRDFGLAAMAAAVAAFVTVLRETGLQQILVHRYRKIHLWMTPAFWMSVALGVFCGLVLAGIAPAAARYYREPRITGLLLVMAAGSPFFVMGTVSNAVLLAELRFRALAVVSVLQAAVTTGLMITLAALGWGAYSLAVAPIGGVVVRNAAMWGIVRPRVRPRPQFRRWRYLVGDSQYLMGTAFFMAMIMQGVYLILGRGDGASAAGIFYFSYGLSAQTVQLLAANLSGVLFPALSSLQSEPQRQVNAFVQAAKMLAYLGAPLCLLQAVLAEPGLRFLYGTKWEAAVPVFQVLSIGMIPTLINGQNWSMLQARGQFRTVCWFSAVCAASVLLSVCIGDWMGSALAVACCVTVTYGIITPVHTWLAIRPHASAWQVWRDTQLMPTIMAVAVVAVTLPLLAYWPATGRPGLLAKMAVMAALAMGTHVLLLRWAAPQILNEAKVRLAAVLRRQGQR